MEQIETLLQVGAKFAMYASPYEVVHVDDTRLRISPLKGGGTTYLPFEKLAELGRGGHITSIYVPPSATSGMRCALTDEQIQFLERRKKYVLGVEKACSSPRSKKAIAPIIKRIAKDIGDLDPPSASSVADWVRKWIEGGRDDKALFPAAKPSRAPLTQQKKALQEIVSDSIEQVWLRSETRASIGDVRADIKARVDKYNEENGKSLEPPHYETVRRTIRALDKYKEAVARQGKQYAARIHRSAARGCIAIEALDIVEVDGQLVDIMLARRALDGTLEVIGRAYLTVLLDVYTRCVLGFHVSLQPFSGGTLMRAVQQAIVPDGDRPRGVPSTLVVDNGGDYQDEGFMAAMSRLGTTIEPCAPRTPMAKPHVERFFKTLNTGLIHKLKGTTFSNPGHRGDYDSEGQATYTIDELRQLIQEWIDDDYHCSWHSGVRAAPIDAWKKAKDAQPIDTRTALDAQILVRTPLLRTVTKGRVTAHGLQWYSPALQEWELRQSHRRTKPHVEVRLDEMDLSIAYVAVPDDPLRHIEAESCHPGYTQGLSLREHRKVSADARMSFRRNALRRICDEQARRIRDEYRASQALDVGKKAKRNQEILRDTDAQNAQAAARLKTTPSSESTPQPKSTGVEPAAAAPRTPPRRRTRTAATEVPSAPASVLPPASEPRSGMRSAAQRERNNLHIIIN